MESEEEYYSAVFSDAQRIASTREILKEISSKSNTPVSPAVANAALKSNPETLQDLKGKPTEDSDSSLDYGSACDTDNIAHEQQLSSPLRISEVSGKKLFKSFLSSNSTSESLDTSAASVYEDTENIDPSFTLGPCRPKVFNDLTESFESPDISSLTGKGSPSIFKAYTPLNRSDESDIGSDKTIVEDEYDQGSIIKVNNHYNEEILHTPIIVNSDFQIRGEILDCVSEDTGITETNFSKVALTDVAVEAISELETAVEISSASFISNINDVIKNASFHEENVSFLNISDALSRSDIDAKDITFESVLLSDRSEVNRIDKSSIGSLLSIDPIAVESQNKGEVSTPLYSLVSATKDKLNDSVDFMQIHDTPISTTDISESARNFHTLQNENSNKVTLNETNENNEILTETIETSKIVTDSEADTNDNKSYNLTLSTNNKNIINNFDVSASPIFSGTSIINSTILNDTTYRDLSLTEYNSELDSTAVLLNSIETIIERSGNSTKSLNKSEVNLNVSEIKLDENDVKDSFSTISSSSQSLKSSTDSIGVLESRENSLPPNCSKIVAASIQDNIPLDSNTLDIEFDENQDFVCGSINSIGFFSDTIIIDTEKESLHAQTVLNKLDSPTVEDNSISHIVKNNCQEIKNNEINISSELNIDAVLDKVNIDEKTNITNVTIWENTQKAVFEENIKLVVDSNNINEQEISATAIISSELLEPDSILCSKISNFSVDYLKESDICDIKENETQDTKQSQFVIISDEQNLTNESNPKIINQKNLFTESFKDHILEDQLISNKELDKQIEITENSKFTCKENIHDTNSSDAPTTSIDCNLASIASFNGSQHFIATESINKISFSGSDTTKYINPDSETEFLQKEVYLNNNLDAQNVNNFCEKSLNINLVKINTSTKNEEIEQYLTDHSSQAKEVSVNGEITNSLLLNNTENIHKNSPQLHLKIDSEQQAESVAIVKFDVEKNFEQASIITDTILFSNSINDAIGPVAEVDQNKAPGINDSEIKLVTLEHSLLLPVKKSDDLTTETIAEVTVINTNKQLEYDVLDSSSAKDCMSEIEQTIEPVTDSPVVELIPHNITYSTENNKQIVDASKEIVHHLETVKLEDCKSNSEISSKSSSDTFVINHTELDATSSIANITDVSEDRQSIIVKDNLKNTDSNNFVSVTEQKIVSNIEFSSKTKSESISDVKQEHIVEHMQDSIEQSILNKKNSDILTAGQFDKEICHQNIEETIHENNNLLQADSNSLDSLLAYRTSNLPHTSSVQGLPDSNKIHSENMSTNYSSSTNALQVDNGISNNKCDVFKVPSSDNMINDGLLAGMTENSATQIVNGESTSFKISETPVKGLAKKKTNLNFQTMNETMDFEQIDDPFKSSIKIRMSPPPKDKTNITYNMEIPVSMKFDETVTLDIQKTSSDNDNILNFDATYNLQNDTYYNGNHNETNENMQSNRGMFVTKGISQPASTQDHDFIKPVAKATIASTLMTSSVTSSNNSNSFTTPPLTCVTMKTPSTNGCDFASGSDLMGLSPCAGVSSNDAVAGKPVRDVFSPPEMNVYDEFMDVDEDIPSEELFSDPAAIEYLLNRGGSTLADQKRRDLSKDSLFVKFDPLVSASTSSATFISSKLPVGLRTAKSLEHSEGGDENSGSSGLAESCSSDSSASAAVMNKTIQSGIMSSGSEQALLNLSAKEPPHHIPGEKPTQVVTPAINWSQSQAASQLTPKTPPNNSQKGGSVCSSPALSAIDRLISLAPATPPPPLPPPPPPPQERNGMDPEVHSELVRVKELWTAEVTASHSRQAELESRLGELDRRLAESEEREKSTNQRFKEVSSKKNQMSVVVEEYERSIASLTHEREATRRQWEAERGNLMRERDEATQHLSGVEHSFNDVHAKYERSKAHIVEYRANVDSLKRANAAVEDSLKKQEARYDALRQHAMLQIEKLNQEMEVMKRAHDLEVAKLMALLKKSELTVETLQENIAQKNKENDHLTEICNGLIQKMTN